MKKTIENCGGISIKPINFKDTKKKTSTVKSNNNKSKQKKTK